MQGALHNLSTEFKKYIVRVPAELENEPFSYNDTKLRPDVRSSVIRPVFLFLIRSQRQISCIVNGRSVHVQQNSMSRGMRPSRTRADMFGSSYRTVLVPDKAASGVSVVSVYDLYGLDVALSFVNNLCTRWKENPESEWLFSYLVGSLCVLDLKYENLNIEDTVQAANLLLSELIGLEGRQPKMLGSLVSEGTSLPPEVLARITGNPFISASITRELRATRCQVPTLEQVATIYKSRFTGTAIDGPYLGSYLMLTDIPGQDNVQVNRIARTGTNQLEFSSVQVSMEKRVLELVEPAAFSLKDYARWFKMKGCDAQDSSLRMLLEVKRAHATVNETNLDTACAWFIQLNYDTERNSTGTRYLTMDQLADELTMMIDDAIAHPFLWLGPTSSN